MTKKLTAKAPVIAAITLGGVLLAAGVALAHGPADEHTGGPQAMFLKLDANGDGQITAEEFEAFRAARTQGIDADGDGFLSQQELVAMVDAARAERITERAGRRYEQLLARADANGDGKLSVEEFAGFREDRGKGPQLDPSGFPAGWDANGDGVVTYEEFQTALADMMAMRMERRGGEHGEHRGPDNHD
jgi:Ca2+-binding EF-hand superfamily protein